jgi:hypothetical protein
LTFADGEISPDTQGALRGLIKHAVRPGSWSHSHEDGDDSGDEERFIIFLPGKMIVHHRRDVQEEVRKLLLELGLIVDQTPFGGGLGHGFGQPQGGMGGGFFVGEERR